MVRFVCILIVLVASLLVSPLPGAGGPPGGGPVIVYLPGGSAYQNTPTYVGVYILGTPPFYVTWGATDHPSQTVFVNYNSAYQTFYWPTPGNKSVYVQVQNAGHATVGYAMTEVQVNPKSPEQPRVNVYPNNHYWGTTGMTPTPPQNAYVINSGPNSIYWTAVPSADWISFYPPYGSIGNNPPTCGVGVYVSPSGLPLGTNTGYVTFYSGGWLVGELGVVVNIFDPASDQPPFGGFDTPTDGSTVRSSIPVTGWALDDVGMDSVKIFYYQVGQNPVYIGDAVFVEGARPDVEAAYPGYPFNYKAGWGYMMLTNFLPNGGNGTYTIYAIAKDINGKETTLGSKTINCDNANAVKPFGAIDTPTQGGTASGKNYANWGWTLTPQPNSIPTDGSTINVYVDGKNLGHPTYNVYREDIADLFPGYANSNGAVGYFYLDTTPYANGVHTIQWTAADNAGNTDGIGSRYFSIQNIADQSSIPDVQMEQQAGAPFADTVTTQAVQLDPVSYTMGSNNMIQVDIGTLLGASGGTYTGFSLHNSLLGPLPVGSTLDRVGGIFFWQPGPAFNGQFQLRFFHTAAGGAQVSIDVTVVRILVLPHTVTTNPVGRQIIVDGSTYTAPHTFNWEPDSSHAISVSSPQEGEVGTRYVFSSWSDEGAQDHNITAPSSSTTYTANFTTRYSLTTSVIPSMGGDVSPSGTNWYNSGQDVEIRATPSAGYTFSHWSGDLSGSTNPASITMNGPKTVTANFIANQYTLTVNINPSDTGSVSKVPDKTTYVYGDVVTLTATANAGYTFTNWSGDASGSVNPLILTVDGNKDVTANFSTTSVIPTAYDFLNVKVKKSKTASFVFKNGGKTNLSITSAITGTDASMFKITSGGGSKTIKPGKTLTIKVAFKPTSTGPRSANLKISCNDPVRPTIDIPLSGTGL